MKISAEELKKHRQLMTDFLYSITMPQLLDIKTVSPDKALTLYRINQIKVLNKYGYNHLKYHITFDGDIVKN